MRIRTLVLTTALAVPLMECGGESYVPAADGSFTADLGPQLHWDRRIRTHDERGTQP